LRSKNIYLIGLSFFVAFFLSAAGAFAARPVPLEVPTVGEEDGSGVLLLTWPAVVDPCEGPSLAGTQSSGEVPESTSAEPSLVEKVCELIYEGKFDSAGEMIEEAGPDAQSQFLSLSRLAEIVREYKAISQRRQLAREAAYKEQLAELEKFQAGTDINDVNDVNNVNLNDVNDIVEVLSVIAKASEFADDAQKEQLLSDVFVKEVLQKAVDKATGFEVDGKWLEAYTNCYYWLHAIDPENEAYSDYAEQIVDKATIAMSFEDSPCETREERFQGVEKRMFIRAINALSLDYVSVIDYDQMATKAIERCELLGEVISSSPVARDSLLEKGLTGDGAKNAEKKANSKLIAAASGDSTEKESERSVQYDKELAAWSAALTALLDEVKSAADGPKGFGKDKFIDVFEKVLKLNEAIVDLPEPVLIAHFTEAALSALDPYTVMVWPRQVQDFEKMMTNEFTGIGIEISKRKGLLTVASLLLDTPAFNSGLIDAGDVIEAVDGAETKDMTLICAVHKITGPAGTKVKLTIRRPSGDKNVEDKIFDITLTRAKIIVPTIRGWQRTETGKWLYMVDDEEKIGYVRIISFSAETSSGLEKVLLELEAAGLRGLILDLRSNSGGLLKSAVAVTDKFLEEGLIVRRQPGFGRDAIYEEAHRKKTHPNYPLVILINSGSASASEIVAGALADKKYKRAILVGTRTHGKGSVQGITAHPGGGAQLKYTMAHYHLPSGQRVESKEAMKKQGGNDWGVGPNVEVELRRSDELDKLISVQRDNDVLVRAGHDNARDELKKHTIEETLAADPQLAIGVLVVKSKLIELQDAKSKI